LSKRRQGNDYRRILHEWGIVVLFTRLD